MRAGLLHRDLKQLASQHVGGSVKSTFRQSRLLSDDAGNVTYIHSQF
jgi:hypothetical protein